MSHFCQSGACIVRIPDNRDLCPEHTPVYTDQLIPLEYLKGLGKIADNLVKLMEGSKLNAHELSTLAHATGYLSAAESYTKHVERSI